MFPSVKHLVLKHAISENILASIPRTGPKGRLLKGDVLKYLQDPSVIYQSAAVEQEHWTRKMDFGPFSNWLAVNKIPTREGLVRAVLFSLKSVKELEGIDSLDYIKRNGFDSVAFQSEIGPDKRLKFRESRGNSSVLLYDSVFSSIVNTDLELSGKQKVAILLAKTSRFNDTDLITGTSNHYESVAQSRVNMSDFDQLLAVDKFVDVIEVDVAFEKNYMSPKSLSLLLSNLKQALLNPQLINT